MRTASIPLAWATIKYVPATLLQKVHVKDFMRPAASAPMVCVPAGLTVRCNCGSMAAFTAFKVTRPAFLMDSVADTFMPTSALDESRPSVTRIGSIWIVATTRPEVAADASRDEEPTSPRIVRGRRIERSTTGTERSEMRFNGVSRSEDETHNAVAAIFRTGIALQSRRAPMPTKATTKKNRCYSQR